MMKQNPDEYEEYDYDQCNDEMDDVGVDEMVDEEEEV